MINNFNQRVFNIVRSIPVGRVMSYGQIAALAGNKRASRAVGYALHQVTEDDGVPWQRVVFTDGRLAFGKEQYDLLRAEAVPFTQGRRVKMSDCQMETAEAEESLWW